MQCPVCTRDLYDDETGACRPCTNRVDQALRAFVGPDGLYARLAASIHPGSSSGGPVVSGSRDTPTPVRMGALSLAARGGVVTILQTWLVDWHEALAYRHPRWSGDLQQQCDQVVHRLRVLLPWAAESHPAFDEFAIEVYQLQHQAQAASGGERPARQFGVVCSCGSVLRITLESPGKKCDACGAQYALQDLRHLPLAERRAA